METIFNCPVCKSELKVEAINTQSMKTNSSLDDAMVIVNLCTEKVRELNKRKTKENAKKLREIAESIKNLLTDVLSMPDGVKDGIMNELQNQKNVKKREKHGEKK